MTAYIKDVAALIAIVAFIASVGVMHETIRLIM